MSFTRASAKAIKTDHRDLKETNEGTTLKQNIQEGKQK